MNARDESSSSSSSMGTPRVSARTRFAPSTPTVATTPPGAGSMHDYGSNDNYRVVVRKSSSLSKGGINGTNDHGGGDLAAGGCLVRGASKKNTSANSGSGAGASANRDRPWRDDSSSSAPRANYDGNYDEDAVEFSASSLMATAPPPPSSKKSFSTSSASTTTTSSTPASRWAQYESNPNLEEESKIATSKAVVRVAERFAKHQRDVDDMEMAENVDDEEGEEVQSTATTAVMGGATGTGYARTKDGTGASTATAAVEMSTTDYVKSRLASLLVDTKQQQKLQGEQEEEEDDDYSFGKKYIPNYSSNDNSNHDHDRVRSEAFKMLNLANNRVCSPPRKGNSNNSGGDDDDDGNLNDTADTTTNNSTTSAMNKATALFRTKGGGIAMREMQEDEIAEIRRNGIASIRGLDRFGKFDRSSNNSSSSYDANYGITAPSDSSADHDTNMNDDPNEETPSLWSSRYSVERQLMAITGGLDSTRMLHRMDMLHTARDKTKSARGLYRASSNAMDGSHVEYGDYTTNSSSNLGFGFSTGGDWGVWKWVRGTLWSDDVELNYDGTTQSLVKREKSMQRRRRRLRFGLLFIVTLGIVLGVLVHEINPNLAGSGGGGGGGGNVNFYVLADEPYEYANIEQLTRDLESVPSDADFVIHLGNVNGDEQSMCREYGFERAAAVLKESPVPVLVIPGDLDWAACGSEEESTRALNYWQIYLGQFDKYWNNANQNNQLVDVEYDTAVVGNFAFIHKGVLFVGISMIDGLTSPGEVTSRLERNVIWTKDKLTKYSSVNNNDEDGGKKSKGYHAVVIFGHAPPSDIQGEYFWPMLEQFKKVDVPVLYLHANKEGSFEHYKPYDEVEKFSAVQLEKQGLEGPMRVVVRGGKRNVDNKFVFERRQTSLKREEE